MLKSKKVWTVAVLLVALAGAVLAGVDGNTLNAIGQAADALTQIMGASID